MSPLRPPAAAMPAVTPAHVTASDSRSIIRSTCPGRAPSARRRNRSTEVGVCCVAGNADDLDRILGQRPGGEYDLAADWVLLAEVLARQRLVDDADRRCAGVVVFREAAAEHDRQLHGGEEIR